MQIKRSEITVVAAKPTIATDVVDTFNWSDGRSIGVQQSHTNSDNVAPDGGITACEDDKK